MEVDERAVECLQSLRDLGYLDATIETEILDRLATRVQDVARFDDVRRIAAEVLFERQFDMDSDAMSLLEEEWKAVFH